MDREKLYYFKKHYDATNFDEYMCYVWCDKVLKELNKEKANEVYESIPDKYRNIIEKKQ